MSLYDIKLDTSTNFKWPYFKPIKTPLDEASDIELRTDFQQNYQHYLDGLLQYFKLPACSGTVKMLTTVELKGVRYIGNPLFGLYTSEDAKAKIDSSPMKDELFLVYYASKAAFNMLNKNNIENIKKKFNNDKDCFSKDFFVINLSAYPLYDSLTTNSRHVSHQNILVISRARGVVYWIEPQTTVNATYEKLMIQSIKKLVGEIGMPDATVINPVETCPQAIAGDRNCMFWAYIIFLLILSNPSERDHNNLIKKFMNKYPTKEALSEYMNGFKMLLNKPEEYKGSSRRKTRRTVKKRKTYIKRR